MMHDRKLNLGFWLATQFANILSFHRPLILGSCITFMAMNLDLIRLTPSIPRITRHMIPLDLTALEQMRLIRRQEDGIFVFVTQDNRDQAGPSTSQPSTSSQQPTMADIQRLNQRLDSMHDLLLGFFNHMGYRPPPRQ